jgi:hypothetical protein
VCYNTYKKWAKRHDVHDFFNKPGKGSTKVHSNASKGKYPLDDILAGMYPDYPTDRFKKKLFDTGYKETRCENPGCGFCELRITDGKTPLLIDYVDGDAKNKALDNIRILCYNCMFLIGRGYLTRGSDLIHNPEKLQGQVGKYKKTEKIEVADQEFNLSNLSEEELAQLKELQ